jgi:tetratricopeptide (TPR) repeat protein
VAFEEFFQNRATHPAPHPNDYAIHATLAAANARLGRRDAALDQLRRSEAALPETKDAAVAATRRYWAAQIYAWLGESDHAIDQLEYLLAIPSKMSVARLRVEPYFASLRSHPRFQRLVEGKTPRRQAPPLVRATPSLIPLIGHSRRRSSLAAEDAGHLLEESLIHSDP